jgi:nitrogen fixation/metabolism regulation signal transduction histidine kinase
LYDGRRGDQALNVKFLASMFFFVHAHFMETKQKRKITNLWLIPEFQSKFVATILISSILIIASYILFFFLYVRPRFEQLIQFAQVSSEISSAMRLEMNAIFQWLVALSLVILMAMLWVAMILSHRAAGPMFRFKKVFEQIRSGDHTARIHLRPKDDFQDVAHEFNTMMDEIK